MVLTTPECVCMNRILQSDRDGKVLFTKSFRNSANIGRARREVNPVDLQKNMLVMTNLHNERYMAVRCFLAMHEQTFRSVEGNKNELGEIPRTIDTNKV